MNNVADKSTLRIATCPEQTAGTTEELFAEFYETKDLDIREELILQHRDLAEKLAGRFTNKGRPLESLISVGTIGLINAVDRFEPSRGIKFTTYATHCILGEIKRYFRDKSWLLKVPRSLKELNSIVHNTIECLTTRFGRSPGISEIARELDVPSEIVMEVMEAGRSYSPCSLDDEDNFCFLDALCQTDKEFRNLTDKIDLKEAMRTLNKREQMILHLFYYESCSQTKIAERLGISQMHVSRLLRQAIKNLNRVMTRSNVHHQTRAHEIHT